MSCQLPASSFQQKRDQPLLSVGSWQLEAGFTLVETLVAVSLLAIAIVAPMLLTVQALSSAAYARDQITASYLAQEGIEQVRQLRDDNILSIAEGTPVDLFNTIPADGTPFTIDATDGDVSQCSGSCQALKTDPATGLYGYDFSAPTIFTRTLTACYEQSDGSCTGVASNEVRLIAKVSWQTGSFPTRSISISENLFRWVQDGSGV